MAFSTPGKNAALAALTAVIGKVSVHDGDPGPSGTSNELSSTRQTVTWNSPSGGAATASNSPVLDITGGDTVSFIGLWKSDGTVFYGSADVVDEIYGGDGTYTIDTLTLAIT